MEGYGTEEQPRTGPVRPPRPSQSFDWVGLSPRVSPRPSVDIPSRLRKRLSTNKSRTPSQLQTQLSPGHPPSSYRYSGTASTTGSDGRRSFRNAVRKLFGRKAKDNVPVAEISKPLAPSRHGHHRSDPGQFLRTQESQRRHSLRHSPPLPPPAPIYLETLAQPPSIRSPTIRNRSPATLQFPKSAQLKPLDLGNPFYYHTLNHGPKRRATLPTLNINNQPAELAGTAVGIPPDSGMGLTCSDQPLSIPESEIGLAVTSTTLTEKRRSRSANDLRKVMMERPPTRNRSEEIKFWRQSSAVGILLHPSSPPEVPLEVDSPDPQFDDENTTPQAERANALSAMLANSTVEPVMTFSVSEANPSSAALGHSRPMTAGADRTHDLERRVAELESSLQEFQFSLEKLTSEPSRTLSPTSEQRQTLRHQHTPSILVDTLQTPSWHPASLDHYQRNPRYEDAGDVVEREWEGNGNVDASEASNSRPRTAEAGRVRRSTYAAFYSIIADERAARYRLETQVQDLQREVTTMATRLERGSWNSYSAPVLPIQHRPRTPEESVRGDSSHSTYDPRIVSRFSGSDSIVDSEIYGLNNSVRDQHSTSSGERSQTPFQMYRTPMEESIPYRYSQNNEMF